MNPHSVFTAWLRVCAASLCLAVGCGEQSTVVRVLDAAVPKSDAGPRLDGSAHPDATRPDDATVPSDDAQVLDAGLLDGASGVVPEAGSVVPEAGSEAGLPTGPEDSGPGSRLDAGSAPVIDASGSTADAGVTQDAGSDASIFPTDDAGVPPEAYVDDDVEDDSRDQDMGAPTPALRACSVRVGAGAQAADPNFLAQPGDLTQWSTYQGNAAHDGWAHVVLDPSHFEVRWTFEDFGRELSSVVAAQGIVALRTGGKRSAYLSPTILQVLSVQSGRVLWTRNFSHTRGLGPPAVSDGVVFAQAGEFNKARLMALDGMTGNFLWKTHFDAERIDLTTPAIDRSDVFLRGAGGVHAFDRFTGAERWVTEAGNPPIRFIPTPRATDVVGMAQTSLHVLDRSTGHSLDTLEHPTLDPQASSASAVVAQASESLVVGLQDRQLFAFDVDARSLAWSIDDGFSGQPTVAAGELYVRNGKLLEARDPMNGDLRWSWSPAQGSLGAQIVASDNLTFVTTEDTTYAIDRATHLPVWTYPEAGELALGQGTLFIASAVRLTAIDVLGDLDSDGLSDWWELHHAEGDIDPQADPDGDGLSNAEEALLDTQPGCADSDGDQLSDGAESDLGLNATNPDSDGDGLLDGAEHQIHHSDGTLSDTDSDGLSDDLEIMVGLNPALAGDARADHDQDGYLNIHEARARTDLQDKNSIPRPSAWAMHQGNSRHDGYQPMWLDAEDFALSWSATLDEDIRGVALGDRLVAVTTRYSTSVYDADDGAPHWASRLPVTGQDVALLITNNSAPTLQHGRTYVHSGYSQAGTLWVRDARTGALRYRRHHASQMLNFLAPTIFDGRVHMNGGYRDALVSLDARSGDTLWTLPMPQVSTNWEPTLTSDGLWMVQDSVLHRFDRSTGALMGKGEAVVPYNTPVFDRDGNAYWGGAPGAFAGKVLKSVHRVSGQERWTSEHGPEGEHGEPSAGNHRVYAIVNGTLEEYHPLHGRLQWRWRPTDESLFSNIVVTASHVFVASERATYALDLDTHSVSYRYPFGGQLALGAEGKLAIFSGARLDIVSVAGDHDGDGLADWWEQAQGGDVNPSDDIDRDGLDALAEYLAETEALREDSDGDGLGDAEEVAAGADPRNPDTDGDTLRDGYESHVLHSDPTSVDTDADGIPDPIERSFAFDPNDATDAASDVDRDGFNNRHEALAGSDPRRALSFPRTHDWAMFRGGPDHVAAQPLVLDPRDFKSAWRVDFSTTEPRYAISSPAVDDEYVYVSADQELQAFSVDDGSHVWSAPGNSGRSSPSVSDGLVYTHSGRTLLAFDRTSGRQVFESASADAQDTYYAPTVSEGVVLAALGGKGIFAFDAYDGATLWARPGFPYGAEPTIGDGRAYFLGGSIYALDLRTGVPAYVTAPSVPLSFAGHRRTTTLILGQAGVLVAGGGISLATFHSASGEERWRTRATGRDYGQPAVAAGRIYVVRDGLLEVVDERTGRELWAWHADQPLLAESVLVTATHVFVSGESRTYALDLATKQQVWSYPAGGDLALSAEGLFIITGSRALTALHLLP